MGFDHLLSILFFVSLIDRICIHAASELINGGALAFWGSAIFLLQ